MTSHVVHRICMILASCSRWSVVSGLAMTLHIKGLGSSCCICMNELPRASLGRAISSAGVKKSSAGVRLALHVLSIPISPPTTFPLVTLL